SNAGVHIAYRDADGNLKYTYIASLSGAAQGVYTIESATNEGVTAAYPKVTIAGKAKSFGGKSFPQYCPNVSYLNNASLNTKSALHFARAAAATPNTSTYWEYMVVPSSVPVNSGATYIMSDTNGNPVIVYKGNNRLYAARLQE
ncbi:MAG: hypothetical protein II707_03895, partial [Spirochaetales bacterium]|nr:hypothetical protein [Spirochaetales bacterium]